MKGRCPRPLDDGDRTIANVLNEQNSCLVPPGVFPKKQKPPEGGFCELAEWTGLEPATPGVTGRYSNRLNYHSMTPAEAEVFELQTLRGQLQRLESGVPTGIRTPVIAVKGRCPRPLDDGDLITTSSQDWWR